MDQRGFQNRDYKTNLEEVSASRQGMTKNTFFSALPLYNSRVRDLVIQFRERFKKKPWSLSRNWMKECLAFNIVTWSGGSTQSGIWPCGYKSTKIWKQIFVFTRDFTSARLVAAVSFIALFFDSVWFCVTLTRGLGEILRAGHRYLLNLLSVKAIWVRESLHDFSTRRV